jgi:hypothetical protein
MDLAATVFGGLLATVAAFLADVVVLTAFTIEVVPLIVPLAAMDAPVPRPGKTFRSIVAL